MSEFADHDSSEFEKYLKRRWASAQANNTKMSIIDTLREDWNKKRFHNLLYFSCNYFLKCLDEVLNW